jgi:hypothetical protein
MLATRLDPPAGGKNLTFGADFFFSLRTQKRAPRAAPRLWLWPPAFAGATRKKALVASV